MFGNKTVASVLKNFTKTIDDLRSIAETSDKDAQELSARADLLRLQATDAGAEATKAINIADKLEKLISED